MSIPLTANQIKKLKVKIKRRLHNVTIPRDVDEYEYTL
jgi:hypothetical protein